MLVILLAFIPWLVILLVFMYLLWKRRNSEFFAHRSIPIIFITQIYVFISSILVVTSLLVDINFCIILNVIYSIALPTCILPLYLGVPGLIVRSELNKMMVSRSNGEVSWKWKLRYFYSVRVKLGVMFIASILQLGIYFCFQYNFTLWGDCQRYSIFPFTIIQIFYFIPIIIIAMIIRKINDPYLIRWEILTTLISVLPAVICLFFLLADKLPFAFQYVYLYASVIIFITNLIAPIIVLYGSKKPKSHSGSDIDISAILTGPEYESFVQHCITNLATENVLFYQDVESYKIFQTFDKAKHIYEEYIERDSPLQINIDDDVMKKIKANLNNYPDNLFDEAQFAVSVLLKIDVIPRWRRSSQSIRRD
jgi:hypothetical protein